MPTHNITRGLNRNGEILSYTRSTTATNEINRDEIVPAATDDYQITSFTLVLSQIKSMWIMADQAITLTTNDSYLETLEVGAADTMALKANRPVDWVAADVYWDHPFIISGINITSLWARNTTDEDANLYIRILWQA